MSRAGASGRRGRKAPGTNRRSETKAAVLVVSHISEDRAFLSEVLGHLHLSVHVAGTLEESLNHLSTLAVAAVLSEDTLPDGDWRNILAGLARLSSTPKLIVTSRLADDALWAEVLNLGGHDVLAKPFDTEEVLRVVGYACGRHSGN
jgi:DNA-binding response OmpR family regulator